MLTLGPHSWLPYFDLILSLFRIDKGTSTFNQSYQGKQLMAIIQVKHTSLQVVFTSNELAI